MSESSSAAAPAVAGAVPATPAAVVTAPVSQVPAAGAAAAPAVGETALAASVLTDPVKVGEEPSKAGEVKTDADPNKEAKPGEVKPGEEAKPVEYVDFALPEGITRENPTLTMFREEASKLGLTQKQAQALVSKIGEQAAVNGKAQVDNWIKTNSDWEAEIKADREIGGANFEPMRVNVAKVFDDYIGPIGSPDRAKLTQELLMTGAGNLPMLTKMMARIAAAHTEGTHVSGNPAKSSVSFADQMYPTHNKPA